MILKESVCLPHEEPYEEAGDQRKILRSQSWYTNAFMSHGFNVKLTQFHDRVIDGYNDEVLFCLEPIQFTRLENQLRLGIKADAVVIEGATKRFCSDCYEQKKSIRHDQELKFNEVQTQIRYRPLEQVTMVSTLNGTCDEVFDTPHWPKMKPRLEFNTKHERLILKQSVAGLKKKLQNYEKLRKDDLIQSSKN